MERKVKASRCTLSWIYTELVEMLWQRYQNTLESSDRGELSEGSKARTTQKLGALALEGLSRREIIIGNKLIRKIHRGLTSSQRDTLKSCGFLRQTEKGEYYFLHLTFQEYFAGAELARMLMSKGKEES